MQQFNSNSLTQLLACFPVGTVIETARHSILGQLVARFCLNYLDSPNFTLLVGTWSWQALSTSSENCLFSTLPITCGISSSSNLFGLELSEPDFLALSLLLVLKTVWSKHERNYITILLLESIKEPF